MVQSFLKFVPLAALFLKAQADAANVLQFENFGYDGTYNHVSSFSDIYSDDCSCSVGEDVTKFSGANSPMNEEVSVHFRGPLTLSKFGYYVSPDFSFDGNDNQDWSRLAYYDAAEQTAQNVTFLTKAGKNSTCLGKGLTYADSDGLSKADDPTILAEDTLIASEEEYVIFSNISCEDSGLSGDCGVYRSDIPAYHGFYGSTKMFLFEFTMPEENNVKKGSVFNWNMPAIWLLNAYIPRTSQYSTNANCSCWRSGCGEFDIFEVKNYTEAEVQKLYATIHDYQGTDDIESGLQVDGYFHRDYEQTMTGGVVFDNDGNAVVFLSDSTTFNETVGASDIESIVSELGKASTLQLQDVPAASSSSSSGSEETSSSKDSSGTHVSSVTPWILSFMSLLLF